MTALVPHQASCVAIDGRAILIEGAPGSGKSWLALTLIDRGAELVADDGLILEARHGQLFARPHPNITGLIEVRNLGLLPMPALVEAVVALVLVLDSDAPRFIEAPEQCERNGVALPLIRLDAPLAIKAELALTRFGLRAP